ncbi:hypothetical protein ABZ816_12330 [Actinosynnema sp. NPDC047251]|uniref:Putative secreted protein n=1 Tax=Saccharothrix espanaensis (strain ATCC 51144 / DSM 44229 / JCM 9112 / NBRC 15066 / NRRL 15764) TaxID=1179773 RepID=K0KF24_SACES|nr:hypothetical protein [Saccharothrix espanaensis]CCH35384.1 putative secreted protein [Saccharothrix espanaensis DSM 44229]
MSRVGRIAFAGITGVLATAAVVTLAITVNEPRPVDVRRVDLSPAQPGVLSATYTTNVPVLTSPPPVLVAPPPQQPVPPPRTTTTEVPAAPPHTAPPEQTTTTRPSRGRPDFEDCDFDRLPDGSCLPWRFPTSTREMCAWLRAHGMPRIEFRDVHGRQVDFDHRICDD